MTLTEFLLARIAEDEAVAAEVAADYAAHFGGESTLCSQLVAQGDSESPYLYVVVDETRVLAECEAKRQIIKFHMDWPVLVETPMEFEEDYTSSVDHVVMKATQQIAWLTNREYIARFGTDPPSGPMLLAMVRVYRDHPDYDDAWRPC